VLRHTAALPPGSLELFTRPDILRDLEGTTYKVLVGVAQHAEPSDQATWVVRIGRDALADALGVSLPTLRKHLEALEERGWLRLGEAIGRGHKRGKDTGPIWLLWTAPIMADGAPWTPPPRGRVTSERSLPVNPLPIKNLPVKNVPLYAVESPHETTAGADHTVAHLHAYQETTPHKHATTASLPPARLLNGSPCPPGLDDKLTALGFHGNLTLPATDVPVETEDLHDLVEWLLADRARAIASGKDFNAAGVLANRVKTPGGLHELMASAGVRGYLARYRAAASSQEHSTRPSWCGECEERTRMREHPESGLPYRCPTCHPLNAAPTTTAL